MGGPRIVVDDVKRVIMVQPRTFEYGDIAREAKISTASAHRIIGEMIADGSIMVDHKIGKRKIYAISGKGSSNGAIKADITQLTPAERFEHVGMLVDMVVEGISPSVLITGLSGIGKTYLVKDRLKENGLEEDVDYVMVKGHSTPMGLYRTLHDHRDQKIVFDDCDGVFKENKAIGILKAALDSYDTRTISWNSERMPDDLDSPFIFTGQIIFVSNLLASQVDNAVKSRTFVVDLQMSRQEICEYIETILHRIDEKLSTDELGDVLTEVTKRCDAFENFNIRTFLKACRIYRYAKMKNADWKKTLTGMI